MIEFQDLFDNPHLLENSILDQIRLIRALANFHVDKDTLPDLENQRLQLLNQIKELETGVDKFVQAWREFTADWHAHPAYDPENERHRDLATQFIKTMLPHHMHELWDPQTFTGSLLVFFDRGRIDSSSLIEKKQDNHEFDAARAFNATNGDDRSEVKVVDEPFASFTVLKSPTEPRLNIYFTLSEPATVFLIVYDEFERVVKHIEKSFRRPGEYSIVWDGRNDDGRQVEDGRYFCQLQIGDKISKLKAIELP